MNNIVCNVQKKGRLLLICNYLAFGEIVEFPLNADKLIQDFENPDIGACAY